MNIKSKINTQYVKGQAIIYAILFFLFISTVIVLGIVQPVAAQIKAGGNYLRSEQSVSTAEVLNDDIIYRLNKGQNIPSTVTLALNNSTSTAVVTDIGNTKEIVSEGDSNNLIRTIKTRLIRGAGVSFNYGLQAGNGGFVMLNGASVIGNVYSNGNVSGGSVTGTVVAANTISLTSDQSNLSPLPPTNSINFATSTTPDLAQSFQVTNISKISKVELYLKKTGSPANATIKITTDSNGSPSSTVVDTATLSASSVTSSYGWASAVFSSNASLTAGQTYWMVIDYGTLTSGNYYTLGANANGYANGSAKVGTYGTSWNATSPSTLDGYFNMYVGGFTSSISNVAVGGDAWAHTITGGSVAGTKYCQSGTNCNLTRSDPNPVGFPISDSQIQTWKDDAEAGGVINGNYNASTSVALGPIKINGNLTINSKVTMTGVIWVTGSITTSNNIVLDASFGTNSGIIVADGTISLSNNVAFQGSGQSGSFIMALTTADTGGYDIDVSNNAGAVILYAGNGTIHFKNNSGANEATADKILVDQNGTLTYDSGLANQNFSTGPSGSWNLQSWKEVAE